MEVFDSVDEFIPWIDLILSRLNGSETYATCVWNEAWQQAAFNATHFGLLSEPDILAHLRGYALSPDSRESELIRNQLRARLSAIRVALTGQGGNANCDLVSELRRLADRFRRIANNDCSEADVRAAAARGGRLLYELKAAGLLPNVEFPDLAGKHKPSDDESHLLASIWYGIVQFLPGNPAHVRWEHRGGPNDITVGSTDTAHWRIRAEEYGADCDKLADEIAAMQSADPVRGDEMHVTSTVLPISRQFFAGRFRELAERFKVPQAVTSVGEAFAGMNAKAAAGELFIEAVDRGYLKSVPGAHELARSYRETQVRHDAGELAGFVEGRCVTYTVRPEALRVPCAENLFIDVAGDDRIEVYNDGGTIKPQRWLPAKGLLPDAVRGMFPARNWPLSPKRDDERHDFMRLERSGTADRYALACRLLAELLEQEQVADSEGSSVDTASSGDPGRPKQYLRNWRAILAALELPNNEESKGWVRRLIDLHGGPIILPQMRGGQPKAEKSKLIEWWNGLEDRFKESDQRKRNRDATVAATHNYGRDGTVAPNIQGSIKRRRTSKKVPKGPKTS